MCADIIFNGILLLLLLSPCINSEYQITRGETRVIKARTGDPFKTTINLPGVYDEVISGTHKAELRNGICSTVLFQCSYTKKGESLITVELSGTMLKELKWLTFHGTAKNLIPVTVFFFNGYVWNDMNGGIMQPQYSGTLIYPARGCKTVTLTFSTFSILPVSAQLVANTLKSVVYKTIFGAITTNNIKKYSQILNLEDRGIVLHNVITLTVKQNQTIDHYAVKVGSIWLTQTIDWTMNPQENNNQLAQVMKLEI